MKKKVNLILIALAIVIVASAGSSYYFYDQYTQSQEELETLKTNPDELAKREAEAIKNKVSKLMELPGDENPTVATVTDVKKIDTKQQPFFAKAQNGDKVLLFVEAKKAILYRESTNKVIEVGAVNVGQDQPQEEEDQEPEPTSPPAQSESAPDSE